MQSAGSNTLVLQLQVSLLHDTQIWVSLKHFRPLGHALQYLALDLLMCVLTRSSATGLALHRYAAYPIIRKSQQRICKAS